LARPNTLILVGALVCLSTLPTAGLSAQEPTPVAAPSDPLPTSSLPARTAADSLPLPVLDLGPDALRVAAVERLPAPVRRARVSVCSGGDVAFGTNLSGTWRTPAAARWGVSEEQLPTPHDLAGRIRDVMPPTDIVLLNVE